MSCTQDCTHTNFVLQQISRYKELYSLHVAGDIWMKMLYYH